MIVGIKDGFKMLGIVLISACAVFVCTLFLNYNLDLKGIGEQIITPAMQSFYDAQVMTGTVVCALSGGCLLLTSVVMLFFYIKQYIDTHQKELGIVKALGYSNRRIAGSFWVFGLSVFFGTTAGYAGAHGIMPKFYSVQNQNGFLPEITMHFHPVLAGYLILVPSAAFAALSVIYGWFKLKIPVLDLLKGKRSSGRRKYQKHRAGEIESNGPFLEELRRNTLRQRKVLVFFIGFATFCYAAMMQMSCSMNDLASVMMGVMIMLIGILLACVTLFLAITTIVNGNTKTIAMMRVFGYSLRQCAKTILGGYRFAAYIGFALGTIYQYVLLKVMVSFVFRDVENIPEYGFDIPVFLITLASFAVIYELVMHWYTNRIGKISVKEIMLSLP